MPSFSIPLTGLESENTALNTIANNLANMSTTGFKDQTTDFAALFAQEYGSNGAGDPIQVGTGVGIADTSSDFSGGPISTTQNTADMALNGSGFFVVGDGDTSELTRAGNFSVSETGQLIASNGGSVMGYPASNGIVDTSASLAPISLPIGQTQSPRATTSLSFNANLDPSSSVGTSFPAAISIFDSLGVSHNVTVTMTNTGANTWSYSVSLPSGDSTSSANTSGTLTFDSTGNLSSPVPAIANIQFSGLTDGAANLSFSLGTIGTDGTSLITLVGGKSAQTGSTQNGYMSGVYDGFSVASNGVISATYSNSQTEALGQLAVANVSNVQGLSQVGGSSYVSTLASGTAVYGIGGEGGLGSIEDSALEGSNVDISTEFSNLIVAQRAFEANSKAVTTFDTVTQEAINMIH